VETLHIKYTVSSFNTRLTLELSPIFLSKQRWRHIWITSPDHLHTTQTLHIY